MQRQLLNYDRYTQVEDQQPATTTGRGRRIFYVMQWGQRFLLSLSLCRSNRRHGKCFWAFRRALLIVSYLALGVGVTCSMERKACENGLPGCTEPLSAIDALYFCAVSISTVGYGDISPSSTGMRVFVVFYILVGVGYIFVLLSEVLAGFLEAYRQTALACVGFIFDRTVKMVDVDGTAMRISGSTRGVSGRAMDLDGDGSIDFLAPPGAFTFWVQELLPAVLLWVAVQLLSAALFLACQEDLDYGCARCMRAYHYTHKHRYRRAP